MIVSSNQTIQIDPPKHTRKITGTRFAAILGLDTWKSPFKVWCDLTKVYSDPFVDSPATLAGKYIEPIVIKYIDQKYHYGRGVVKDPFAWFGKTTEQLRYDHFPDQKILGGMWDARTDSVVYELKTSGRVQDWVNGSEFDAPIGYKLQGALYAYLMGLDRFRMVLSITDEQILANPALFVPTPINTMFREYSLKRDLPEFPCMVEAVLAWYDQYILGGVSPAWNATDARDMAVVKSITTQTIVSTATEGESDPIEVLLKEIEPLQTKLTELDTVRKADDERLKTLKDQLRTLMTGKFTPNDKKVTVDGQIYSFELGKSVKKGIDSKALEKDGLLTKYQTTTETYTLRVNAINKEETPNG